MTSEKNVISKICMFGDGGVGKTSLIGRFVHNKFDAKYITTLGTRVSKKEINFECPDSQVHVKMGAMIWDIMGQKEFMNLLKDSYFHGANGLIAVCDLTQRQTLESLNIWIDSIAKIVGNVPIVILANKNDLADKQEFGVKELQYFAEAINAPFLLTSAKTGENVDCAFEILGRQIVKRQLNLT